MMRKILLMVFAFGLLAWAAALRAQDMPPDGLFSPDQLDNLVAPIALYPDPLLAQVLLAATFPDQIDEAARFVRTYSNSDDIDGQWWDVSVKSVAHYPTVLDMMADKLDWTTSLGQAYAYQSTDVMMAVQRLRVQARNAGNLVTTPELEVVESGGEIELWPAQPEYLYVPQYDPAVIFFYRAPLFFGARFFIGAWLNYDFDWRLHRVFYHGWEGDRGWIGRSRRYVHVTDVYVNNTYRNVEINRSVIDRRVNYGELNRYDTVHRQVTFNDVHRDRRTTPTVPYRGGPGVVSTTPTVNNKIINRNINTADPRINEFRGHVPHPPQPIEHTNSTGFTPGHGSFDTHTVSVRGQTSRALVVKAPPPPPPPRHDDRKKH
ncbi:MAG: DUF3300 domain-containing protein [Acidobacteriia bacterium]|nr:DUF3300 domain-containing protein [Terriglobia bacterium]